MLATEPLKPLRLPPLASLTCFEVGLGGPLDTGDDVGHGARAVGAQHLDGVDVGLLGNTVLLAGDGTRAVSAVAVAVDILVAAGDGLAPVSTTLKVNVVGVGAGVDDVGIDTLATVGGVEVLVEGAEAQGVAVGHGPDPKERHLLSLAIALCCRHLPVTYSMVWTMLSRSMYSTCGIDSRLRQVRRAQ